MTNPTGDGRDRSTDSQVTSTIPAAVADSEVWRARARSGWRTFDLLCVTGAGPRLRVHEPGRRRRIAAWPLSQAIWAGTVMATGNDAGPADPEALWNALHWYRRGGAYVDNRPRGTRYFDDNAWLGLAAAQQALLTGSPRWWARAATMGRFVARGVHESGGVRWVEGGETLNACSTGSAGLLLHVLASDDAALALGERAEFAASAVAATSFLRDGLRRSDGLVADHLRADGTVEPSVWAYNQGLALQLAARSGDTELVTDLRAAMRRGLAGPDLWRQPAAFVCIWLRSLLAVAAGPSGSPAVPAATAAAEVADYLSWVWQGARDGTGLFSGVPRYDEGIVLDHVAVTGLMAAYAAGPAVWRHLL